MTITLSVDIGFLIFVQGVLEIIYVTFN